MTENQLKNTLARLNKYVDDLKSKLASTKPFRRGGTKAFLQRDLELTTAKINGLKGTVPTEVKKA